MNKVHKLQEFEREYTRRQQSRGQAVVSLGRDSIVEAYVSILADSSETVEQAAYALRQRLSCED